MELYEIIYLISFLAALGITLIKLSNILSGWQNYDIKDGLILFIGYIMAWGVMFITSMFYISVNLMSMLFKLSNGFFALNSLFLITEIIYLLTTATQKRQIKAYNAKDLLNYKV